MASLRVCIYLSSHERLESDELREETMTEEESLLEKDDCIMSPICSKGAFGPVEQVYRQTF